MPKTGLPKSIHYGHLSFALTVMMMMMMTLMVGSVMLR